jgi:hypothetical protein
VYYYFNNFGGRVEELLHLRVREQKRLNTTDIDNAMQTMKQNKKKQTPWT